MTLPAYLPNTQPKNNSSSQMRRRVNDSVSAIIGNTQANAATQTQLNQVPAQISAAQASQANFPEITNAQIHTTANAGGATALPATPAGYTVITLNGKAFKIPLYEF
jgi:hypothetical protein